MVLVPRILASACLLLALSPFGVGAQTQAHNDLLARGEYVLKISGCSHCHTAENGEPLAGGRALATPFGTFYSPNITSHKSAGIGAWSENDFRAALHHGVSPDGSDYYPAFPFTSYARMLAEDARALQTYLLSLPASAQPNRAHELAWFVSWRLAAKAWKWLFFDSGEFKPDPARSPQWNRGAYIADALGHCGECHTPRNLFGALRFDQAYAGNAQGPDDELVPNITPDKETGIGNWSRNELRLFLQFGEYPNGEYAAGSMDPVIQGLQHLTPQDRDALIDYLLALPPIDNRIGR
ncbi:MAG: cytochrome c [Gammaproteobacteria bacterium]|nr:cytochrome c [Gammaproteobacteria bacterium]